MPLPDRVRWNTILPACALGAITAFFVWFPITDTDIWWHLAAAREMLAQKRFLIADPFSFTPHNPLWINLHWLFQLVVYAVHAVAGVKGLIAFKCAVFAVSCIVINWAVPGKQNRIAGALIIALLMFEARYLVLERPVIITLILMALYLWYLERYSESNKLRWLATIVPLQIVWTNSQGLWAIGIAIAGIYWVGGVLPRYAAGRWLAPSAGERRLFGREFRDASLWFTAIGLSCFVNPYGWRGVLYPLRLFERIEPSLKNIYAYNVSENLPLAAMLPSDPRAVFVVVLAACVALALFWINRRRVRAPHLLLFAAFFCLATMAQRNILLFLFVAAPIIAYYLPDPRAGWRRIAAMVMGGAGALLLLLDIAGHARVMSIFPRHGDLSPFRHPVEAVEYLKNHPAPGRVFNTIRYGGYLSWELYPPYQVFIDGRLIIRTPRFFADFLATVDDPRNFSQVREKYGITQVLVQTAIFYRDARLAQALYADSTWRLVYADGACALFVLDSLAATPRLDFSDSAAVRNIVRQLRERRREDPAIREESLIYFGDFCAGIGEFDAAESVLRSVGTPASEKYLARCLLQNGKIDDAETAIRHSLLRARNDCSARLLLARILYAKKDYRHSLENVIFILMHQPFNEDARQLLSLMKPTR
jgi:hypothetical protein